MLVILLAVVCVWASAAGKEVPTDSDSASDSIVAKAIIEKPPLLWKVEMSRKVVVPQLLPDGNLLAITDSGGCTAINTGDGGILWTLDGIDQVKSARFDAIPYSTIGCLRRFRFTIEQKPHSQWKTTHYFNTLEVIDYRAGRTLWNSNQCGFYSVHDVLALPQIGAVMVYGRDAREKHTWTIAVNQRTGEQLWRNDSLFGVKGAELVGDHDNCDKLLDGNQPPIFDSDSTMILCMDKEAIRRVDVRTGRVIWRTSVRGHDVPALIDGYSRALLADDHRVVYIPCEKSLLALNTDDGSAAWKSKSKLPGMVYQMEMTPQGLLLRGGPDPDRSGGLDYLTLIDCVTGDRVWKSNVARAEHRFSSNFVLEGDTLYVYAKGKVFKVGLHDGSYKVMTKSLKFDRYECNPILECRNSSLILSTNNCLAKLRFSGEQVYESKFASPSDPLVLWTLIGAFAGNIVGNLLTGQSTFFYPSGLDDIDKPVASKRDWNFSYIVTNVRDDSGRRSGIVKVNRLTGIAEKGIKLGDMQPQYVADEAGARLYYVRDSSVLECYSF